MVTIKFKAQGINTISFCKTKTDLIKWTAKINIFFAALACPKSLVKYHLIKNESKNASEVFSQIFYRGWLTVVFSIYTRWKICTGCLFFLQTGPCQKELSSTHTGLKDFTQGWLMQFTT